MMAKIKGEKGFSFIEVVISLAILGIIAVGFLSGLATSARGLLTTDEQETAKNIAEAHIEYVRNHSWSTSYLKSTDILGEYPGYDVEIFTTSLEDGNIQKITITVSHQSKPDVITLENYKVRR
jgi:prepilin-type N-terminal cleavage/methylation domain-containing protein